MVIMTPFKSSKYNAGLSSGGGSGNVGINADNDLLGIRNLTATQKITAGTLQTGKIKGTGDITIAEGTDLSFIFGNAKVGWTGNSAGFVGFSHKDQDGLTEAALQQTPTGTTIVNASSGQNLWLGIAGVPKFAIAPNGLVGINNLSPAKTLDVGGEIKASGNLSSANIETTTGLITGPASMTIDPAVVGNNTGLLIVKGNLQVEGTTTTINSTTVSITDKKVELAADATSASEAHGAGFEVFGSKTFTYESGDKFVSSVKVEAPTLSATSNLLVGSSSLTSGLIDTLGAAAGTVVASKAVIASASKDITGFNNITSDGTILAAVDTDKTHKLGFAAIGDTGFDGQAGFGHTALLGDTDGFALLQTTTGATILHSHAGQKINFRVGTSGINSMTCLDNGSVQVGPAATAIAGSMLDVKGRIYADRISCSAGQDISSEFGMAVIGHMPPKVGSSLVCDGDAVFAHKDYANCLEYCIKQRPDGRTIVNAANGRPIQFRCNNATFLTIKSNGCLGINLADPSTRLAIDGDLSLSGFVDAGRGKDILHTMGKLGVGKVAFNGWAGVANVEAANTTDYALIQSPTGVTILNGAADKQIEFKLGDGLKMKLASNGFFGIGRATPTAKLDVNGNIFGSSIIVVNTGGSGINILGTTATGDILDNGTMVVAHSTLRTAATSYGLKQTAAGSTTLNAATGQTIALAIGGASKLHMDTNGKVGIGLTNPSEELDVAGDIKASGTITASDDRLKHNETTITNGLSVIRQLNPMVYDKTKEFLVGDYNGTINIPHRKEAGFIAQEVKLINEVSFAVRGGDYIDENGNNVESTYGVNYNDLYAYNVAATKELDTQVSALQQSVGLKASSAEVLQLEINTGIDRNADRADHNALLNRVAALEARLLAAGL